MIDSIDDALDHRIAAYTDLRRDDSKRTDVHTFVVEGRLCVQRLTQSSMEIESILVQSGRELEAASWVDDSVPIYSVPQSLMCEITGFNFHRGFLALGRRPAFASVVNLQSQLFAEFKLRVRPSVSLATLGVSDRDNLGVMMRTATGFGIHRTLLCDRSADPLSRRTVRTSMATVFKQSLYRLADPAKEVQSMVESGIRVLATSLDASALPLCDIAFDHRPIVLAIGSESDGIPRDVQAVASDRVTIPMRLGVDSLNAGVAAGIFMYHVVSKLEAMAESAAP
jgi:tRNA G18 (ribose-2'-O)-methylase SpoU